MSCTLALHARTKCATLGHLRVLIKSCSAQEVGRDLARIPGSRAEFLAGLVSAGSAQTPLLWIRMLSFSVIVLLSYIIESLHQSRRFSSCLCVREGASRTDPRQCCKIALSGWPSSIDLDCDRMRMKYPKWDMNSLVSARTTINVRLFRPSVSHHSTASGHDRSLDTGSDNRRHAFVASSLLRAAAGSQENLQEPNCSQREFNVASWCAVMFRTVSRGVIASRCFHRLASGMSSPRRWCARSAPGESCWSPRKSILL